MPVSGWARRSARTFVALSWVALGLGARAGEALSDVSQAAADSAAALEGLPIRRVTIVARDVFEPMPGGPLRPVYGLANRLHVTTKERAVREQLLFAPGEPWSQARGDETMRALRRLDFLEPQAITATRAGDSVDVRVETRDAWTTQPELNFERGGGQLYGTIGLSERNLFGLGKALGFLYHEDPTGITRGFLFQDPAVVGSRVRLAFALSTGTAGSNDLIRVGQPFYAENTRSAWEFHSERIASVAHLFVSGSEVAAIDRNQRDIGGWYGRGVQRGRHVWRATAGLHLLRREQGPTIPEGDVPEDFLGGPDQLDLVRLETELRWWRPSFMQRTGIQRVDQVEDFDAGTSFSVLAGYAPDAFGSTASEGYLRGKFDTGLVTGWGFGLLRSSASCRLRRGALEIQRDASLRWVSQSHAGHTLVLSAIGAAGSEMPRDYQLVVGGLNGLRAYPVQALAGRELVRLNAEQRLILAHDVGHLLSFGVAGFYDAARAWGPGAEGTSWFSDVGAGIRLAPPAFALGPVFRIDVAWPISPTRDGEREAVYTFGSSQAF